MEYIRTAERRAVQMTQRQHRHTPRSMGENWNNGNSQDRLSFSTFKNINYILIKNVFLILFFKIFITFSYISYESIVLLLQHSNIMNTVLQFSARKFHVRQCLEKHKMAAIERSLKLHRKSCSSLLLCTTQLTSSTSAGCRQIVFS